METTLSPPSQNTQLFASNARMSAQQACIPLGWVHFMDVVKD